MAKAKKKSKRAREREADEHDEDGIVPSARDFVMARLAAARSEIAGLLEGLDGIIAIMVDPEGADESGDERDNLFENVLDDLGAATRSLELAQEVWESDEVDPAEGEPDVDPSDDEEEDEDPEDEDDED